VKNAVFCDTCKYWETILYDEKNIVHKCVLYRHYFSANNPFFLYISEQKLDTLE